MNDKNPSPPEITVKDEGFDISALRAISVAESKAEETASESQDEDTETVAAEEDTSDKQESDDTSEASSSEGDSDSEEENEEKPENTKVPKKEEVKPSKYLEAKHNDKTYKIPVDAEVTIPVDGKEVTMKLTDAFRKASGNLHIEKETSRLGRERKKLETEKIDWQQETEAINANLQAMMEITDPFEFCSYYGALTKKDPQKVFQEMVKKTQEYLTKFESMTENERNLEAENRKLRIAQKHNDAKVKRETLTQQQKQERSRVEAALKSENLTMEDFQGALVEMQNKLNEEGSLGEEYDDLDTLTPNEVIKYALNKQLQERVTTAINGVNKELSNDESFVNRLKKAIYSTERLHGKMSSSEVSSFVKAALDVDKKHLSENLSKKVKKTTSKPVSSDKEDEDGGPVTFSEYLEKRGGFKPLGF